MNCDCVCTIFKQYCQVFEAIYRAQGKRILSSCWLDLLAPCTLPTVEKSTPHTRGKALCKLPPSGALGEAPSSLQGRRCKLWFIQLGQPLSATKTVQSRCPHLHVSRQHRTTGPMKRISRQNGDQTDSWLTLKKRVI